MYRFVLFVFLFFVKQSVSQDPTFIKFIRNDIPINSLSEKTFSSVHNANTKYIYIVKLQSCQISFVDETSFQQMLYLRVVSMPYNQIREIPWGLFGNNRHIKIINFANNEITMLQDGIFENLILIESISFAHNKIVRIESNVFKDLIMLKKLDLSNNHIKNLWPNMFISNMNLQKLQLDGNKIETLGDRLLAPLENLVYLDLNRNQISRVDVKAFENLKSLVMLNMELNYISDLDVGIFDSNTNLRALLLNENNLDLIENGLFTKLMKLEHLNLRGNKIQMIGDDVFPKSANLSSISLCRNQLMSLQAKTFENLYGLRTLCVADNPWYCDCNIMDFHAYYINNYNITKETIICYQPEKLGLRAWTEISSSELICDPNDFKIEDIRLLPIANDSTKVPDSIKFPPFIKNSLDLPTDADYENENMTMERIAREEMQIAGMKIDLGAAIHRSDSHTNYNDDYSRLPDCFINKPTHSDEQYNKNFVQWRARFLGEFLIMYTSARHKTFYTDNDIRSAGSARLVPNQNGFTFMDPSLTQNDWRYINDYLQEICSVTNHVLNGEPKNVVRNYAALQEVDNLIDSLSDVVKSKLKDHPDDDKSIDKREQNKEPVREVHHMIMKTDNTMTSIAEIMPHLEHLPKPNLTEGKNLFYYIINARAEGQGYVNINTGN